MATTRLMPLHIGKGRTVGTAIAAIIDYVENPGKTDNGNLITSWQCDSRVADSEFLFSKQQYIKNTGRVRGSDDVIAYHLRQSFRPGEIPPEEANRLGCELARRFTKGNHPRITLESAKTIFSAMMDMLSRRQAYDALESDASFAEVRKNKGISKADFSRIIEESMYIAIPTFQEIDQWMGYPEDEKLKAALEYTKVMADIQGKSESFATIYRQIKTACQNNQRDNEEAVSTYCNRIYCALPNKNPIYNKEYVGVLTVSMLINEWRMKNEEADSPVFRNLLFTLCSHAHILVFLDRIQHNIKNAV